MRKLSILRAILVVACCSVINAQQPQEPSVSSQPTDKKTKYLLETTIVPQLGPSFFAVNGPKEKLNSMQRFVHRLEFRRRGEASVFV